MIDVGGLGAGRRHTLYDSQLKIKNQKIPLRWVVAARIEWIAAADTPDAAEDAGQHSVFLDRQDEILAAAGMKAAIPS